MNNEAKASKKTIDEVSQLRSRIAELEHELSEALTEKDALRERESQFRLMAESISDVIFEVDHQGAVVYFSPSGKDVWGYNREDVIGENFIGLVHPDDQEILLQRFIELSTGVEKPLNYRLKDKAGNFRWVRTKTKPRIENGAFVGATGTLIDISDQKQVEEALRHRESYLSAIIENQPGLVWLKDTESRFLAVNQSFAISCGKQKGEELVGKTDFDIWPRELAEKYRKDDYMIMEMGKSTMVEEPIYDKGETRWFETFKTPVFDGQGTIIGTTGYARDITERRRAEDSIQANEARLTAVFDSVQDFIFIKDTNRRYRMINKYFQNRFHVDPSVFLGYTDSEIPIFENKDTTGVIIQDTDALVLRGEAAHYELTHCICGTQITFDIFKTPIRDGQGNVTGICGLSRDTTERKRVEDALRESEELFRVSIEKAPDGIYMNDLGGNFLYGNKKAEEIIGYKSEELIGQNFLDLNIIAEKSMAKAAELLKANIEGRSTGPDEIEMVRKDGSHILIEITTNVIHRGGQTNVLAFVRDITERKLAEASLRESELFSREMQRIARLGGWKANPHTDFLKWTDGVYDIIEAPRNYSPSLSEGITFFQPEYIPIINSSLSKCLATGEPFAIECEIITQTGKRQWTEVRGLAPVVDGERSSVMGTFQDITDRKQAGKKLRESEELFRLLFNTINDAVFLHYGPGPDGFPGKFIELNNIACERLGYSREELLKMSPLDIVSAAT